MTAVFTDGADHSPTCTATSAGPALAAVPDSLAAVGGHVYPLPVVRDPRFSLALLIGVGEVLERHGYPTPAPLDWVDLQQALGRFLYREDDVALDVDDRQLGGRGGGS